MTIRTYAPCTVVKNAHPHLMRHSVRNSAGDLLASADTEAEALEAKRAFENVLAPRFTRDEAIAIVKDAIARSSEPDSRLIPGIRLTLEALAECGAFRDGDHEHEPDGMRAMLNAAGIR